MDIDQIRKIRSKEDEDARFGHKTPTKKFFGFKTHIAMSDDRIITGIKVTDGARPDGIQLPGLIEKSKENGVDVKEVIGDMAYVSDANLEVCEKEGVTLYARTNLAVAAAANTELEEGFSYSKDAHMQSIASQLIPAKKCPLREQCKVGKSKTHTYNITRPNAYHKARLEFESSEIFKKKFQRADSVGLVAMRLQAYFTTIIVNMKRIVTVIPV